MKDELLWSWTSENARTHIEQLPLSVTAEKYIALLLLTIISFIMILFIGPMLGNLAILLFIAIYVALIPYTFKNYKNSTIQHNNQYINIYNNRISVNYYGYNGNYDLNNILPGSIKIKYIMVGTMVGVSAANALCFKTKTPEMQLKIPLPILEPSLTELTNSLQVLTRHSSGTHEKASRAP